MGSQLVPFWSFMLWLAGGFLVWFVTTYCVEKKYRHPEDSWEEYTGKPFWKGMSRVEVARYNVIRNRLDTNIFLLALYSLVTLEYLIVLSMLQLTL